MSIASIVPPAAGLDWVHTIAHRRRQQVAIEAKDLGVRYDLRFRRDRSVGQAMRDAIRRPPPSHIWALRHIDLTVRAGDCLAVVGPNGAGKSTLLQVIARLLPPDEGSLRTRGPISALLNLGVGFDPRLTGRENVELIGALIGLDRARIATKVGDVVSFADLGEFIDAPLRTYSSGMRARLGFAAATMIEPNVLVLDEVLGTGDATFREKSRVRLMELVAKAHAVVTATHDMTWVAEFATYAVLLDGGRVIAEGSPSGVAALHRARSFRPARTYACATCANEHFAGYCPRCGLRRYDRRVGYQDVPEPIATSAEQ